VFFNLPAILAGQALNAIYQYRRSRKSGLVELKLRQQAALPAAPGRMPHDALQVHSLRRSSILLQRFLA
jgi:hypothetical protein